MSASTQETTVPAWFRPRYRAELDGQVWASDGHAAYSGLACDDGKDVSDHMASYIREAKGESVVPVMARRGYARLGGRLFRAHYLRLAERLFPNAEWFGAEPAVARVDGKPARRVRDAHARRHHRRRSLGGRRAPRAAAAGRRRSAPSATGLAGRSASRAGTSRTAMSATARAHSAPAPPATAASTTCPPERRCSRDRARESRRGGAACVGGGAAVSRLETPVEMAARLAAGESVTAATMRGILAEVLRERDAAILARLDEASRAPDAITEHKMLLALIADLRGEP